MLAGARRDIRPRYRRDQDDPQLEVMQMHYIIPRGAPVEISLGGSDYCPHVTKRDLTFSQALASTSDELTFHDGYWRIVVARALVLKTSGAQSQSLAPAGATETLIGGASHSDA